jgi:hypothetical protein
LSSSASPSQSSSTRSHRASSGRSGGTGAHTARPSAPHTRTPRRHAPSPPGHDTRAADVNRGLVDRAVTVCVEIVAELIGRPPLALAAEHTLGADREPRDAHPDPVRRGVGHLEARGARDVVDDAVAVVVGAVADLDGERTGQLTGDPVAHPAHLDPRAPETCARGPAARLGHKVLVRVSVLVVVEAVARIGHDGRGVRSRVDLGVCGHSIGSVRIREARILEREVERGCSVPRGGARIEGTEVDEVRVPGRGAFGIRREDAQALQAHRGRGTRL